MKVLTDTAWPTVMTALGFEADADLIAMHFDEFETEACLLYTSPSPRD